MTTLRHRYTIPVAIVLALSVAPMLTGCFGNPVQSLVKGATGGGVDLGGTSIPADFPSSVPLYKGKVVSSLAVGTGSKKVWNISIVVPDPSAMTSIKTALTGAGFKTEVAGNVGKVGATLISSGKKYGVAVVLAKDDNKGFVVNYTVTPAQDSN